MGGSHTEVEPEGKWGLVTCILPLGGPGVRPLLVSLVRAYLHQGAEFLGGVNSLERTDCLIPSRRKWEGKAWVKCEFQREAGTLVMRSSGKNQ